MRRRKTVRMNQPSEDKIVCIPSFLSSQRIGPAWENLWVVAWFLCINTGRCNLFFSSLCCCAYDCGALLQMLASRQRHSKGYSLPCSEKLTAASRIGSGCWFGILGTNKLSAFRIGYCAVFPESLVSFEKQFHDLAGRLLVGVGVVCFIWQT